MKIRHKKMARCLYRVSWERCFAGKQEATMQARWNGYKWWRSFKGVK